MDVLDVDEVRTRTLVLEDADGVEWLIARNRGGRSREIRIDFGGVPRPGVKDAVFDGGTIIISVDAVARQSP